MLGSDVDRRRPDDIDKLPKTRCAEIKHCQREVDCGVVVKQTPRHRTEQRPSDRQLAARGRAMNEDQLHGMAIWLVDGGRNKVKQMMIAATWQQPCEPQGDAGTIDREAWNLADGERELACCEDHSRCQFVRRNIFAGYDERHRRHDERERHHDDDASYGKPAGMANDALPPCC
jgi:hypothetical protein